MSRDKNIDELFSAAKKEPVGFSYNNAKFKFQESLNAPAYASTAKNVVKQYKILKILIMSLTVLGTIILGLTYFFSGGKKDVLMKNKNHRVEIEANRKLIVKEHKEVGSKMRLKKATNVYEVDINSLPVKPIPKHVSASELRLKKEQAFTKLPVKALEQPYLYFPKLTPDEISENDKRIKDMVKDFSKKKKGWSLYPSGTFVVDEKQISLQAFYVKTTEVTNLEYKTFLFDLLKNGNKDAFNKAKPNQQAWIEILGDELEPMTNQYFSHPAFEHYPVNNISAEGAQMYCDWFTSKVNEEYKAISTKFRLPVDAEWRYVASEMGRLDKYAWEGAFLRNSKGCYLSNFYAGTESDTLDNDYTADGGMFTVKVDSYFPNAMGVYTISGNVAEMVMDNTSDTIKVIGGSFLSNAEELLINYPAQDMLHIKGAPDVGFRPVITYMSNIEKVSRE